MSSEPELPELLYSGAEHQAPGVRRAELDVEGTGGRSGLGEPAELALEEAHGSP